MADQRALLKIVKALVPRGIQTRIRTYLDYRERRRWFGDDAPLVPPPEAMFDGPQGYDHFKSNGEEFLAIYRDWCGLRQDEVMLDIGSGIGRKTLPLTHYFDTHARYDGIDPMPQGVEWCRSRIAPRFPNFRFQRMDVRNRLYNPNGSVDAIDFVFPFGDDSFTFVTLGSVFTHLVPAEVDHYLGEIRRMLRPKGRCLASFFLLNDESLQLIAEKKSKQSLPFRFGDCLIQDEHLPESAIAHPEAWVAERYRAHGLTIQRIAYGSWCGRTEFLSCQDLVLCMKP